MSRRRPSAFRASRIRSWTWAGSAAVVVDQAGGTATAVLEDGSTELVRDASLGMDQETGRFECAVRGGRFRARLSRSAHQMLLDHVMEENGAFFLRVGPRRITLRT